MPTPQKSALELKNGVCHRYVSNFMKILTYNCIISVFLLLFLQLGTLGAGNHYAEIQVVDEIFDARSASKMGIEERGQVCVMIHSGSRGFGHQVATDALVEMEKAMKR